MELLLVGGVFFWVLFGIISALIASGRGRSGCGGFALGVLLGPFGLLIALFLSEDQEKLDQRLVQSGERRHCPNCMQVIHSNAKQCPFCDHAQDRMVKEEKAEEAYLGPDGVNYVPITLMIFFAGMIAWGFLRSNG